VANTLASLRKHKDDRQYVLENVDKTDIEFLDFIEKEEKRIEDMGFRAGERLYNQIQNNPPTFFKEHKDKKPSIVFELVNHTKTISSTFLEQKHIDRDKKHVEKHLISNQAIDSVSAIRTYTTSMQQITASQLKKAIEDNKKNARKTLTVVINIVRRMLQCNCEQYLPEVICISYSS
jgi:hypothetical protein